MKIRYAPRKWVLMHDGASSHTSYETTDYLKVYANVLEGWLSGSPDLNPIENLWAIVTQRITELNPETIEDLEQIILEVWDSVETDLIHRLIDSMRNRLQVVKDSDGGRSGY